MTVQKTVRLSTASHEKSEAREFLVGEWLTCKTTVNDAPVGSLKASQQDLHKASTRRHEFYFRSHCHWFR